MLTRIQRLLVLVHAIRWYVLCVQGSILPFCQNYLFLLQSKNHLLATYRCQIDTNRVDLKLRTIEGYHGTLYAYITPSLQPKVSQVRKYIIRPLSMHQRVHSWDETRPYNTLSLKGTFSAAEMHNWISYCVPEIPQKMQTAPTELNRYNFENVFAGTLLQCDYGLVDTLSFPSRFMFAKF